ncbi:MAG: hypothetical protein ACTTJ6_02480 [Treponema sp.]
MEKYIKGMMPPIYWLIIVAKAAPFKPHPNTATKKVSKMMLVMPASMVI